RSAGVVDGHQRLIERLGDHLAGAGNPADRIAAQPGSDHAHDQKRHEDSASNRSQLRGCARNRAPTPQGAGAYLRDCNGKGRQVASIETFAETTYALLVQRYRMSNSSSVSCLMVSATCC